MAKTKERKKSVEITIRDSRGAFSIFKKSTGKKDEYNFSNIFDLRQVLSNEKARILDVIKTQKPQSIYDLAKKLGRNFKSVSDDTKLLEKFGFVKLIKEKTKQRVRSRPEVIIDRLIIDFKI